MPPTNRALRTPEPLPPARPLRERVGHVGEAAAVKHLEEQGLRILAKDWRSRVGQADIIAEDGNTVVLVEVKARRGSAFGPPQEAVDARKQRKLRTLLEVYRAQAHKRDQPCRIDVIALMLDNELGVTKVEHVKNAVEDE